MVATEQQIPYLLGHRADDIAEDHRLNEQFFVSKTELYGGHTLHPIIVARRPHLKFVADLGCGTAIWLRDVSRTYFSSGIAQPTLIGWGLHPTGSHNLNQGHKGLQVFQHDCVQPIDARWYGQFDVNNLGSMAYATHERGWAGLFDNVYKLLSKSSMCTERRRYTDKVAEPGDFLQRRDAESKNFIPIDGPPEMSRALELWTEERQIRELVTE